MGRDGEGHGSNKNYVVLIILLPWGRVQVSLATGKDLRIMTKNSKGRTTN